MKNKSLLFKLPTCDILLWQLKETNTTLSPVCSMLLCLSQAMASAFVHSLPKLLGDYNEAVDQQGAKCILPCSISNSNTTYSR